MSIQEYEKTDLIMILTEIMRFCSLCAKKGVLKQNGSLQRLYILEIWLSDFNGMPLIDSCHRHYAHYFAQKLGLNRNVVVRHFHALMEDEFWGKVFVYDAGLAGVVLSELDRQYNDFKEREED